ncbi:MULTISPECIES: hypothetical protein [Cytobacillus]|uniref:Uncharacterized protein n=1 Tax=Cytobacillus oceanisediminis TaxID=665099 RepID=A0ABX3CMW7_9BACI|nr:hypothetical protein [Cytobacillus oceanisediminis]EFV75026.1 hypothetical protein HMPREF1013_04799 [Bacillus sp. 2_A_57_CT2]MCM3402954.1 hypothetical protein [Cytobacillus oceanisediminis]OHX45020.1 hypothetical protein BBV17_24150 [Cytobacillus oceanisediminis]QOK30053.1 hypothetical protein IIE26_27175 [Cytobacillus oceanisediminis]
MKVKLTSEELCEMTMDLIVKRLSEESPHLSNPEYGHGSLEIVFTFNSVPRVIDSYSVIKASEGEFTISFPSKKYNELLLKNNIRMLYNIVQKYLSTREVPQGKLTVEFSGGIIINCYVNNEGTYRDIARNGKPKLDLDDILFGDEED